jgi:hypothetical protein
LYELWKKRSRKSGEAPIRQGSSGHSEPFHPGEWKHPTDITSLRREGNSFATKFPSPLKESLKENEHPVCGIALPYERLSGMERDLLYMAQKQFNLVVRQVKECLGTPQFS